jgi:SAM-dependent methyltransferase
MMKSNKYDLLVCPKDMSSLERQADLLHCNVCSRRYSVLDGLPVFFSDEEWNDLYLSDGGDNYASDEPFQLAPDDPGYLALRGDEDYGVVLDLGCGDGVFSSKIPETSLSYCVDVTEAALRRLQRRNMGNLVPMLASGYELPFADNTFDTVLYIFVVEHIAPDNDLHMLQEIRRVLKNDGKLIFTTDTPFFDRHIVRWTSLLLRHEWITQDHSSPTGHINLITMKQSRSLVQRAGFHIEAEHPYYMGTRLKLWMGFLKLIRKWALQSVSENYLTSKYTFVLTKSLEEAV